MKTNKQDEIKITRIVKPQTQKTQQKTQTNAIPSKDEDKQFAFEGTLEAITEIVMKELKGSNGVLGPGFSSWKVGVDPYTKIIINTGKEKKDVTYNGIILSDSIGNTLKVYREITYVQSSSYRLHDLDLLQTRDVKLGKFILFDSKLDRWYM
jgi:hypothetical protein